MCRFLYVLALTFGAIAALPACSEFRIDTLDSEQRYRASLATNLVQRADQARAAGNNAEALALLQKALEADPANLQAHMGIGDIYEVSGDYERAAAQYAEARSLDPSHFGSNYKLGLMYHLLDRLRDAVAAYLSALTIDPNSFEANLNLATAYLQLGQPSLALPYADKAVRLNPSSQPAHVNLGTIYSSLGRHNDAVLAYRDAADRGELTPPIAMNLVNALIKTNNYQRAVNTLESLIRTDPRSQWYERLGYAYFKLSDFPKSMEAYERALQLDPNDTSALNGLGVNLMTRYIQSNREDRATRDRAIEAWRKSVQLNGQQSHIVDLIARYGTL